MAFSTTVTMPGRSSDWLKHELDQQFSRATIIVEAGAGALVTGTVLGKKTATGKYVPHVNGASDGTEVAAAILVHPVDATDDDIQDIGIVYGAIIIPSELAWDDSVDDQAKVDAALAQLKPNLIKTAAAV